ncbi:MAG: hypothetical protein KQI35_17605 [Bacteroidetes bacterium]|nr:hypothetical protein [Bacteroidota bacterium]
MKKITLLVAMFTLTVLAMAQPPHAFKYQAVVRNADGELLANQNVSLRISIIMDNPGGMTVYAETHNLNTTAQGIAILEIGSGTPVTSTFSMIDWGLTDWFLKIELDESGGSSYTEMGTVQLLSVPYALYAEKARNANWTQNEGSVFFLGKVGIGTSSPDEMLELTGNIKLHTSTDSLTGLIRKDDLRFIHDFAPSGSNHNNIFIGENAGNFSMYTDGMVNHSSDNVGIGKAVLKNNETGYENVAIGSKAMLKNTTGKSNTSMGFLSMYDNTIGNSNAAYGRSALTCNTEGSYNTGVGTGALFTNTTGAYNTALGWEAARTNVTGNRNVANGSRALYSNYYGNDNVAIGYLAGYGPGTPSININGNVIVGSEAGYDMLNGSDFNVLLGYRAGYGLLSGSNNILIGENASTPSPTSSDHLNIGNALYGDLALGNIGIGTSNPTSKLEVAGTITATAYQGDGSGLSGTGDQMGDHIATQNIALDGHWISGDGNSEGIYINSAGQVGINNTTPTAELDVESAALNAQLLNSSQAIYGVHYISGSYGSIGASNLGVAGYSPNGYAVQATSPDGFAIYGASLGSGYAGYFEGKGYISGNLGIGVSNPTSKLEVDGTVTATAFAGDGSALTNLTGDNLGNHSSTQNIRLNNHWLSGDGGNEGVYVNSTGKVGIGTNAPGDCILDVHGNINMNVASGSGMSFRMRENNEHRWTFLYRPWVNSTLTILDEVGNRSIMVFEPNTGCVGINTTNPSAPIHILGGSDISLLTGGYLIAGNTSSYNIVIDDNEIMARNNGSPSPLVLNQEGGNVAIGNAAQNLLDVRGAGSSNGGAPGYGEVTAHFRRTESGHSAISVDAETEQDAVIYLAENGSALWSIRTDVSDDANIDEDNNLEFRDQKNGANQVVLEMYKNTGYDEYILVPHGNISPSIASEYWCGSTGRYWFSVHSHLFLTESSAQDLASKKGLKYGLKDLLKLDPIEYNNQKTEGGLNFGLDPEQLASVIPEVTLAPGKDDDSWGIRYNELIPVLINAIKEQQDQIDALKLQVSQMVQK